MFLPDYKNNSILNLISLILKSMGGKSNYTQLDIIDIDEIAKIRNIILILIDGMGYEFLLHQDKKLILTKHIVNKITSVFPPTTATAITTFLTGLSPAKHCITGWFVFLKEIGLISTILKLTPRCCKVSFRQLKIKSDKILPDHSIFNEIKRESFLISDKNIVFSDYSLHFSKNANIISFKNMKEFFKKINDTINCSGKQKFIYAYWSELDSLCHKYGTKHEKVRQHFKKLDEGMSFLLNNIKDKNTMIIITADHGLINTEKGKTIYLKDHPYLSETLTMPLSGDPRTAYCYVKPDKVDQFEYYIMENMNKYCNFYKSEDLVEQNVYGPDKFSPLLLERIGDYVLIMKENYAIKDFILGEKKHLNIGNHGGVSKEEMFVPLIVINLTNI